MKVFHGSIEIVRTPEIRMPDRPLDYGSGFYTTTSHEQAEAWVGRKLRGLGIGRGYVNVYEFDEVGAQQLRQLKFDAPTEEWIEFVMSNRIQEDFTHDYDIVYGPVANDRVYIALTLYEGEMIGKEELLRRLKAYKLVDQYLFHTKASLRFLKFIEAKEVKL